MILTMQSDQIMSIVLKEWDKKTLDFVISYQTIGLSLNKIFVSIIDLKAGLFAGYSLDKDYHYHGWYGGICFSLVKF